MVVLSWDGTVIVVVLGATRVYGADYVHSSGHEVDCNSMTLQLRLTRMWRAADRRVENRTRKGFIRRK